MTIKQTDTFPIAVGAPVYGVGEGNLARYSQGKILEGKVTKIGRIYFHVKFEKGYYGTVKFSLEDFSSRCEDCNSSISLFPNEAAIRDHVRTEQQLIAIREAFQYGRKVPPKECIESIWETMYAYGIVPPLEKE